MSVTANRARQPAHSHVVGVYDCDDALVPAVATFLVEALHRDGVAIVIATAEHRVALEARLTAHGYSLGALEAVGRYHSVDAAEMLERFMNDGKPEPRAFAAVTDAMLDHAAKLRGPVRAFGEMVALLWEQGDPVAAIEVESMWNEAASRHCFDLFCAYAVSSLEMVDDLTIAKQMCDRHSSVVRLPYRSALDCDHVVTAGCDDYDRLFVANTATIPSVRGFVRSVLRAWGEDLMLAEAELIASELATNAIEHARSPFRVSIARTAPVIRISVRDASFEPPERLVRGTGQAGGRGVRLVADIAHAWGTSEERDGKTVWAEMERTSTTTAG